ncbi:hypothetical protein BC830DRAFT_1103306 [Chytriomyces sp. MP71]|nr:hypothetical protein BC830DRAFT_1103306 [Chytriomyces sp. MP71]
MKTIFPQFLLLLVMLASPPVTLEDLHPPPSGPKLRIAFVHPDLGIGGAERLIVDSATGLQKSGHKVVVFTSHHDPAHCFEETRDGTLDVRVRGDFLPRSISGKALILCAILRSIYLAISFTFLEAHRFDLLFVDQLSISIPILRFTGSKILFYCHFPDKLLTKRESLLKRIYRIPFDWLEEVTTRMADCTVVNSNFTRQIYRESFPSIKTIPKVLYPAIRTEAYNNDYEGKANFRKHLKDKTILVSINRFERKKNIALAIQSFSTLQQSTPDDFPNLVLVVAGGYDPRVPENVEHLDELTALASSIGLRTARVRKSLEEDAVSRAQVIFVPSFDETTRAFLLAEAAALIYTPTNEHFGIVPVEAMYARLPVVATNTGGPLESVLNGVTGYLCEPEPGAFGEALTKLVKGGMDLKTMMGEAGRGRVEAKFTLEAYVKQLESILEEMFFSFNWDAIVVYVVFVTTAFFILMGAAFALTWLVGW